MFEYLQNYEVVLVTGPQRAGTTITARMIGHDTRKRVIDEAEFNAMDVERWRLIVTEARNAIVHCPSMMRFVADYAHREDLAVVTCRRPVDEIVASQQRIGWAWEHFELQRYADLETLGTIAETKYLHWDSWQKARLPHAYDVEYASLARHPLFVHARGRVRFHARQWQ